MISRLRLKITDYFDFVINKIDVLTETELASEFNNNRANRINERRRRMIEGIKKTEHVNLRNLDKIGSKELDHILRSKKEEDENVFIFKEFCFLVNKTDFLEKPRNNPEVTSDDLVLVITDRFISEKQILLFMEFVRQHEQMLNKPVDCDYCVGYTALNSAKKFFNLRYEPDSEPFFTIHMEKKSDIFVSTDPVVILPSRKLFKIDQIIIQDFLVDAIKPKYAFLFDNIVYLCLKFHHKNSQPAEIAFMVKLFVVQKIELELWNCRLISIDSNALAGFGSCLSTLSLNYNQLASIGPDSFTSFSNLLSLSLKSNNLSELKSLVFASLHFLEELDLSENRLKIIENGLFASLVSLKTLLLSRNKIELIESGAFADLSGLGRLCIKNNLLQLPFNVASIFKGLYRLEDLCLSGNSDLTGIRETEFSVHLPKLKALSLI